MPAEKINLQETEEKLITLINNEKSNWIQIAKLMNRVEETKAYPESFTKWVNELAIKAKVHVSLLWQRKKAGKAISEYLKRAEEKGVEVPKIDDINTSVDNIVLATKIAGRNTEVKDELLEKVIDGELHRSDLKGAWKKVKEERAAMGLKPTRTNRHEKEEQQETLNSQTDTPLPAVTAYMILTGLKSSKAESWYIKNNNPNTAYSKNRKIVFGCFDEVAVRTGTTKAARRIDAVIIENKTNIQKGEGDHGVTIQGFEIKVSKSDLLNDTKMGEYTDFVDYFWVAIPDRLEETAKEYCPDSWGIVIYKQDQKTAAKKQKLHVVRQAQKQSGVFREKLLEEIVVKRLPSVNYTLL